MSITIDSRVTPALHPQNIHAIEGYDEDTAPFVAPAEQAFSEAYTAIGKVHNAREAAKTNPTWNHAQQVIETQEFSDKIMPDVLKRFDSVLASLGKSVLSIEDQLSGPIDAKATHAVASEIRAHIKSLPEGKRFDFIRAAIQSGDHVTVTSALGTVPYLSGIDADAQIVLTRLYHEKVSPVVAKRLKVMKAAKEMIEERGGMLFSQMERAVGFPAHEVKSLRDARNASVRSFSTKANH